MGGIKGLQSCIAHNILKDIFLPAGEEAFVIPEALGEFPDPARCCD